MKGFKAHFTRVHLYVFLGIWAVFTLATFWVTNVGLDDGPQHNQLVAWTTLGTISGPMTGAISRRFQSCCLAFSLNILPFSGAFLLAGIAAQFIEWPFGRCAGIFRLIAWIAGWFGWFLGGLFSFAHALG